MDRDTFFARVRASVFRGRMNQGQVDGLNALLNAAPREMEPRHLAYCLATAFHEVGGTMQPILENMNYTTAARIRAVWPSRFPTIESAQPFVRQPQRLANHVYGSRMGNRPGTDDGFRFRGRGFVQITGRDNYTRAGRFLAVDLIADPERALELTLSARILYQGMTEGWFTGQGLSRYFNTTVDDPVGARRIVNGLDRAADIASYHRDFLAALTAAGYRPGSAPAPVARPAPAAAPAPRSWWQRFLDLFRA
jgi:putative chitinase